MNRCRPWIAALLLVASAGAAAAPQAVLIEVRSADCIACDLMAQQLADDPRWAALSTRLEVRRIDRQQPEAAALLRQHPVGRVPTWLLLDADGEELGRIAGATAADPFHRRIAQLLAERSSERTRRNRASEISSAGAAALAEALASFHAQGLGDAGFAWWLRLPIAVRGQQSSADPEVLHWRNRIEFLQAVERGNAAQADVGAHKVLDDPRVGCDRGLELARYLASTRTLDAARRRASLTAFRATSEAALETDWFAEPPRCLDGLSLVLATADLLAALDDAAAEQRLLMRAIHLAEARLAAGTVAMQPVLSRQRDALRQRLAQQHVSRSRIPEPS